MQDTRTRIPCKTCSGKGYVQGMGYMRSSCKECEGKGFNKIVSSVATPSTCVKLDSSPPKRRGRPPKNKDIFNG